jgi:hypothetical protein
MLGGGHCLIVLSQGTSWGYSWNSYQSLRGKLILSHILMINLASTLPNQCITGHIQLHSLLANVMQEDQLTQGVGGRQTGPYKLYEKWKMSLSRMTHECMSTCHQFQHLHIPVGSRHNFRGQQERWEHMFLVCPFGRVVWAAVKEHFPLYLHGKDPIDAKQWVFDFRHKENGTNSIVLVVTCLTYGRLAMRPGTRRCNYICRG